MEANSLDRAGLLVKAALAYQQAADCMQATAPPSAVPKASAPSSAAGTSGPKPTTSRERQGQGRGAARYGTAWGCASDLISLEPAKLLPVGGVPDPDRAVPRARDQHVPSRMEVQRADGPAVPLQRGLELHL